jgi:hypothetical protein
MEESMTQLQVFEGVWEEILAHNSKQFAGRNVTVYVQLEDQPQQADSDDSTLALLAQWREEDATDDPDELNRRDAQTRSLLDNINRNPLALRLPERDEA